MLTKKQRFLGALVAVVAVLFRFNEYTEWVNTTIATEFALGLIRIPVLAVTLLIATLVLWPRRRKILEHIDISVRKPVTHIICLALAFFLLPVGSFTMNNLFYTPEAPGSDQAKRILRQILFNTYTAFNLEDEEQLYDQLSQNVSDELVADLYLDSRRRLFIIARIFIRAFCESRSKTTTGRSITSP
jgi:hypothetical protein